MNRMQKIYAKPSLSVRIGRVGIRVIILGLLMWGGMSLYDGWWKRQRAREIAPIHAQAEQFYRLLKRNRFFQAQIMLSPSMQHQISIDRIAQFVQDSTLNETQMGQWSDWNRTVGTHDTDSYSLQGTLRYTHDRTVVVIWHIVKIGDTLHIQDLVIGKYSLRPEKQFGI